MRPSLSSGSSTSIDDWGWMSLKFQDVHSSVLLPYAISTVPPTVSGRYSIGARQEKMRTIPLPARLRSDELCRRDTGNLPPGEGTFQRRGEDWFVRPFPSKKERGISASPSNDEISPHKDPRMLQKGRAEETEHKDQTNKSSKNILII